VSCYRIVLAEKARTPISVACELLGVSTSGYYDWASRAPSDRALSDAWLIERIKAIHADNREVYGSRRVTAELRLGDGVVVSRKRVQRLMRRAGLSGLQRVKRGRTTIRVPGVRVADDLVERNFRPAAPDVLWVTDITYLRTWEGWVYLAAVQDAFSRRIVGWSMADHMRSELVVDALQMAVHRRRPEPGLVCHSDQGSQGGFRWSLQRLDPPSAPSSVACATVCARATCSSASTVPGRPRRSWLIHRMLSAGRAACRPPRHGSLLRLSRSVVLGR
jgi:putative transposase